MGVERLAELRIVVAEKVAYPCRECGGKGYGHFPERGLEAGDHVECPACVGTGKVYPLRWWCPEAFPPPYPSEEQILALHWPEGEAQWKFRKEHQGHTTHDVPCSTCADRGWVPAEAGLHDLMAAAGKCGIRLSLSWEVVRVVHGIEGDDTELRLMIKATGRERVARRRVDEPIDGLGILCAAYEAVATVQE